VKGSDMLMATLAETLINDAADLGKVNTLHQDSPFVRELPGMIQKVASDYMKHGIDLNESIYKVAQEKSLTDDQVQRLVEESNNQVYMAKYASLKGNRNREVQFKLADGKEIKARLKGEHKMEKKASATEYDAAVFQSGTFMKCASFAPEKKSSVEKIIANKVVSTMNDLKRSIEKYASEIGEGLTAIAQSVILQESLNKNGQDVFNDICKNASWDDSCMDLCISAVGNSLKYMKSAREISDALEVDLHKYQKTASYDMGKYSFNKEASYTKFSPVVTPDGVNVQSLDSLTKIACEVKDKMAEMSKTQSKLKYIEGGFGLR
jgi:hypothetical protein